MKNPICISTGLVYLLTNDKNKIIEIIREFSPDGIELSFADPQYIFDFSITKENLEYLQSLKFNSIHGPWKNIEYGDNHKCKDVLKSIEDLYKKIGARNVNFHLFDVNKAEDTKVFNKYNFNFSVENDDFRNPGLNTVEKIDKVLRANEKLKFTFDFAHALVASPQEIPVFINRFRDKLAQVHLSYLTKEMKDHWFLHKYDSKEMRDLLNYLKSTNVPIVLECVASNWEEISLVKKEIEYIKAI